MKQKNLFLRRFAFFLSLLSILSIMPSAMGKKRIVLVHGVSNRGAKLSIGPVGLGDYFYQIPNLIRRFVPNVEVHVVDLPTDRSIGARAQALQNFLTGTFKNKTVHLICHSIGGLDARYAAWILKSPNIQTITTIATPHHGTPLADWAVHQINTKGIWYYILKLFGRDISGWRFLPEITTKSMAEVFNQKVFNRSDIGYYSVIGYGSNTNGTLTPAMRFTQWMMSGQLTSGEMTDGIVPKSSQEWGTVLFERELDHLSQINHHFLTFVTPGDRQKSKDMWRMLLNKVKGFKNSHFD